MLLLCAFLHLHTFLHAWEFFKGPKSQRGALWLCSAIGKMMRRIIVEVQVAFVPPKRCTVWFIERVKGVSRDYRPLASTRLYLSPSIIPYLRPNRLMSEDPLATWRLQRAGNLPENTCCRPKQCPNRSFAAQCFIYTNNYPSRGSVHAFICSTQNRSTSHENTSSVRTCSFEGTLRQCFLRCKLSTKKRLAEEQRYTHATCTPSASCRGNKRTVYNENTMRELLFVLGL